MENSRKHIHHHFRLKAFMTLTADRKAEIIAAVLKSPMVLEIVKQYPVTKWNEPNEIADAVAAIAKAVIAASERMIA